MAQLKGDEMFRLQKAIYDRCGGLFGFNLKEKTLIAVCLDTACLIGMQNSDFNNLDLEAMILEKMRRLHIDLDHSIF